MELKFAGAGEFVDLFLQRLADAWDALQIVSGRHGNNFTLVITHGLRAIAVGAGLEWVLTLDFHKEGDLIENRSNFIS